MHHRTETQVEHNAFGPEQRQDCAIQAKDEMATVLFIVVGDCNICSIVNTAHIHSSD